MKRHFEGMCGPWFVVLIMLGLLPTAVIAADTFDPYCEGGLDEAIWLIDDFEDGNLDGWLDGGGSCNYFLVHDAGTAAEGEWCLDVFGDCGSHRGGPYISLAGFQAGSFTIWVRANFVNQFNGYVVLDDDTLSNNGSVVFFYGMSNGTWTVADHNGYNYSCGPRNPNQWYQVQFAIDWDAHTFDVYIDNVLEADGVPFPVTIDTLNWLSLYNMGDGHVWYDYIVASTPPPTPTLFIDGFETGDWSQWSTAVP